MEEYYKQEIKPKQYKLTGSAPQKAEERDPEMWHAPQGGGVCTTPLILGDIIFFGAFDTYFYALNKNTGAVIWKFKTGDVIISSPAIEKDILVFGSQDGFVYALEAASGKMLWKYRTGGLVFTHAVFYKGNIYIGSSNGYMHCFSPSGDLLWRYKTGSAIYSTPAFLNGKLYFGSYDKHFYCLNTNGELVWKYYVGEWVENSPAIFAEGEEIWSFSGGKDYEGPASVCFGAYNKNFYVLDADSGALQWMRRMDGIVGWSHPTVQGGKIYFGDWSGYLYCLDAESGAVEWKILTGGNIDSQPLIHSSYIYFGSQDGNMCALSLDGKISWKYQTGGIVFCRPAVENNILYFGSMDTNFYAMDVTTRRIIWKFVTGGGRPAPLQELLKLVEQIKESQKIFSAWKPELIKPAYKEDKNLTFVAAPSEHAYAMKEPYKTESPYQMQQKKKKEPWER